MSLLNEISKCEISISENIDLFEYKDLNPEMFLVQGYKMKTYKVYANNNSLDIINKLYTNNYNDTQSSSKITNLKRIDIKYYNKLYINNLREGKNFLQSKFKLHNIYSLNNGIVLTSPFNINISRLKGKYIGGFLETTVNEIDIDEYEVLFRNLSLPIVITNILPSIYSHEIIHTQIMSLFGSVDNFFNNEILPIFIELLYQYENNINSKYRLMNLHLASSCISKDAKVNIGTFGDMLYYTSIISAYKLLNIYIKGNNFVKKEIINNIQSVFDNKFTVEDLLSKYDLDWTKKRVIH